MLDAIEHLDETIENSKQRVDAFHETYIPYECENSSRKVFNMMTGKIKTNKCHKAEQSLRRSLKGLRRKHG